MSYEGKNIVKNSVTLNEVTKANAEALPSRNGKLLNVNGELFKDNGNSLDKIVTHDAKSSKWGFTATTRRTVADWSVTGTAAVDTVSALQGEPNVDSFQIDLTGAGDSASIVVEVPNSAIDARSNLVTINYMLFDQAEPVRATFLDWDGNQIGVVDLPATGSGDFGGAAETNLRWKYISTDIMFPFFHGGFDNSIEVVFSSENGLSGSGVFLINNIQFDSNAGVSGEWVEVNSVSLSGVDDTSLTADTENVPFTGTGKGWNGTIYEYTVQDTASCEEINGNLKFTTSDNYILSVYVDGVKREEITDDSLKQSVSLSWKSGFGEFPAGTKISLRSDTGGTLVDDGINTHATITETSNHQGVVKEGEEFFEERILSSSTPLNLAQVITELTIDNLVIGKKYQLNFQAGMWVNSSTIEVNLSNGGVSLGKTRASYGSQNTLYGSISKVFVALDTSITVSQSTGGYLVADDTWLQVSEDFSNELLIPNHVTRLNGQEYPVMGEYVELADGTRYQVYERGYVLGSIGTVDTIQTGLTMLNVLFTISNSQYLKFVTGIGTSGDNAQVIYNTATGVIHYYAAVFNLSGTSQTFRYYDTARPL